MLSSQNAPNPEKEPPMLALRKLNSLWTKGLLASVICFSSMNCTANPYSCTQKAYDFHFAGTCLMDHLEAIDDAETIDEVLIILMTLRQDMMAFGCFLLPVSDLMRSFRNELRGFDIEICESDLNLLIQKCEEIEKDRSGYKIENAKHHKHHKKKKKMKMSSKMTFGFLKFIAGSICCIIPIPAIQGVGIFLAGSGINDMIEEAQKEGDQKEKEEELRALELQIQQTPGN